MNTRRSFIGWLAAVLAYPLVGKSESVALVAVAATPRRCIDTITSSDRDTDLDLVEFPDTEFNVPMYRAEPNAVRVTGIKPTPNAHLVGYVSWRQVERLSQDDRGIMGL